MAERGSLVTLEEVRREYRGGGEVVEALRGVSLEVEAGDFVAVQGASGSGKSTLLHLIGCLDRPSSGKVWVEGREVACMGDGERSRFRARRLGFVFQRHHLIPVLSARENVEYPLRLLGVPAAEARRLGGELLEVLGLAEHAARRPGCLSGGQCQRVAIARALVTKPSLVVADEPTANLDSETGLEIVGRMRKLSEELATTFVVATHDPLVAERAKRTVKLHDGRIE